MADADDLFGNDDDSTAVEQPVSKSIVYNSVVQASLAEGGRSVVATEFLPAGTLIACEWPFITWNDLNFEDAQSVYSVLRSIYDNQPKLAKSLTSLYPQELTPQLLENEIHPLSGSKPLIHDILALNLKAAEMISTEEIYRLLLVLQHNAFDSGLYAYLSMFNHSCVPNCIKFSPTSKSRGASEIWTTRDVQAGEELVISYYHPLEDKIGNIHAYLQQQHHFRCQCARCAPYTQHSQESAEESLDFYGNTYREVYQAIELAQEALASIHQQEQDVHTLYIHDREEDIPVHKVYAHIQALYAYISQSPSPLDELVQRKGEGQYLEANLARNLVNLCAKYHDLFFQTSAQHTHAHIHPPQPHTHSFSHILTVHTIWIVASLYLIQSKTRYAGADHPDYSMHYHDILNSYEVVASVLKEHHIPMSDTLERLNQAVTQAHWTVPSPLPVLPKTHKPPHGVSVMLAQCQKSFPLVSAIYAQSLAEKTRLEKLYHLVKRYPDIVFVKKAPGAVYMGKA
eukprot:gene26072-31482_t